jgi:hypothetical protein
MSQPSDREELATSTTNSKPQSRRNQGTANNTAKARSTHIGHAIITGPCQKPQPGTSPVTSRSAPSANNIGTLSRSEPTIWTATFIASSNDNAV